MCTLPGRSTLPPPLALSVADMGSSSFNTPSSTEASKASFFLFFFLPFDFSAAMPPPPLWAAAVTAASARAAAASPSWSSTSTPWGTKPWAFEMLVLFALRRERLTSTNFSKDSRSWPMLPCRTSTLPVPKLVSSSSSKMFSGWITTFWSILFWCLTKSWRILFNAVTRIRPRDRMPFLRRKLTSSLAMGTKYSPGLTLKVHSKCLALRSSLMMVTSQEFLPKSLLTDCDKPWQSSKSRSSMMSCSMHLNSVRLNSTLCSAGISDDLPHESPSVSGITIFLTFSRNMLRFC
mmetsp:Transcript_106763/g.344478  ORF Transcript_106763/g.344478 Transcript_106763/m.344478 type:complete len:291 (+) Transcript_106763:231-1103(+)